VHTREPSEARAEEPTARAIADLVAATADAVPDTFNECKVVKKGKAAVAHQDPKYRKLQ
jgi:hypothetical protein